jgi:uncharacterized protein YwgA
VVCSEDTQRFYKRFIKVIVGNALKKMEPSSFILAMLLNSGGTFESVTKLQKLAFLAIREKGLESFTDFKWHFYGPYSEEIQKTIDNLKEQHIISERVFERTSYFGDKYTIKRLSLTPQGRTLAYSAISRLSNQNRTALFRTIEEYGDKPLARILDYVYKAYSPETL